MDFKERGRTLIDFFELDWTLIDSKYALEFMVF